jgi:hypothetical protein
MIVYVWMDDEFDKITMTLLKFQSISSVKIVMVYCDFANLTANVFKARVRSNMRY